MTTPKHCPGFENFRHLSSFKCRCPECGQEKEIFSDEFDKTHLCDSCGKKIDFTQCSLESEAQYDRPFPGFCSFFKTSDMDAGHIKKIDCYVTNFSRKPMGAISKDIS